MQGTGNNKTGLNPLLYGYLHTVIVAILLATITGLVFHFSSLSESNLRTISIVIIVVSVFWGSFKAAQNSESRGLLHGLMVGLLFLLTTIIITFLISEPLIFKGIANRLLFCVLGGCLGGVIGALLK
ncbi:MAG TPA: TIGR04086 family membrane protein [Clostridia bacterium]|jgi:putative membrane protein (TIGR04086 family)|nr:TIGR04086 family membrane protein [Clostridia bacterium]